MQNDIFGSQACYGIVGSAMNMRGTYRMELKPYSKRTMITMTGISR